MEELDLKELFQIFWNKKVQILLIILIFIVIGIIYTVGFVTPMYSSSTTLVLAGSDKSSSTNTTATDSITTSDITINSKLVATYSELVKSKNVLRQVISNLGINVDEAGTMYDAYTIANYGTDRFGNAYPVYFINYGGGQSALYTYLSAILIKICGFSLTVVRLPALIFSILYMIFASVTRLP